MNIQGVLVEYQSKTSNELYTTSGALLSKRYVIITGNLLLPYLKELNLTQWIGELQPGVLNFQTFDSHIKVIGQNTIDKLSEPKLWTKSAEIFATFICKNILISSQKYLKDWAVDIDNKQKPIEDVLSLFFILRIIDENNKGNEDLIMVLAKFLDRAHQIELEVGREVFIESTPLGNRAFLNSYSQGVISNVTGQNLCFLLSDCPAAPGSEGAPVFIKAGYKERVAIGIVISSVNWWKGEWMGMTLAANLVPLLSQIVSSSSQKLNRRSLINSGVNISKKLLSTSMRSLVQLVSGSQWGTAILLDKEKGIFLTNSHVIESDYNTVIHWRNKSIKATLIYKTPNSEVYDLAVLKCDASVIKKLDMLQAEIAIKPAEIGEEVFAVGFPLFDKDLKPKPTLTKGHVSQTHKSMIKTTCCVLPGASGGAIFRPDGRLLAVIVSNTKMEDVGAIYPRINMCIPIMAVYSVIESFLHSGDSAVLKRFHSDDVSSCRQWNYFSGKL